jgi:hypothetical protein
VFIEYGSGLAITIEPLDRDITLRGYADLQIGDGVPGTIASVAGVEAFVVPTGEEGDGGSVKMMLDETVVTVVRWRSDLSDRDLMRVSTSIVETADEVKAAEAELG